MELQTVNLEANQVVRRIAINGSENMREIWGMKLIGDRGQMVFSESWNMQEDWTTTEIKQDFSIIGVYGCIENDYIVNLGFLIWYTSP